MSVGLDIGSRTIKIAELAPEGKTFRLKGSGVVGYKGASLEKLQDDKDLSAMAQIISKLHQQAGISTKDVSIALPETQVFTRTIKFPLLTDQEIASAVKWEAEQYIPIPINEAIVQHQILERRESATPPEVAVLLVASARKLVEKYVKVIQLAKLNPVAVETELMAITRALAPENQTALVVDFGARSTDIAIAKNKQLSFSRSIPTAGNALTRALAQNLGVSEQQAEEYKRTYGMATNQLEGKVKGALEPVFAMVVDEIKKAIHFHQSEEKGDAPVSAIVSGGTASMPEIISILTNTLGLEVSIANPFANVAVDSEAAKALAPYAPLYSIAVGLAMRPQE
mgnify:CR=1 FL=1